MSIRVAVKLFVLSLVIFAAAFAVRRLFFADVMPVSWDQPPQSQWALQAAFLLRSVENLAAAVAAITLVAAVFLIDHRRLRDASKRLLARHRRA